VDGNFLAGVSTLLEVTIAIGALNELDYHESYKFKMELSALVDPHGGHTYYVCLKPFAVLYLEPDQNF
jgi:hypothetical protein